MTAPTRSAVNKNVSRSLNKVDKVMNNSIVLAVVTVFSAVLFGVNLFLTGLAGNPSASGGLFIRGISQVSADFPLNITPSGFTFSIWGVIYLLQIGWILYSLGSLCRNTDDGPVYLNPIVLSSSFFLYYNISTLAVIGWLFAWDRLLFLASFIFLGVVALSLVMTVVTGTLSLARNRSELIDQGRSLDVKVLTVTMVNGISMYATWTSIAALINLGTYLTYRVGGVFTNELSSIVCVSILAVLTLTYILLDATILRAFLRDNYAPYVTVVWALIGVLANNLNFLNISSYLSIGLLVITSVALVAKTVISVLLPARGQFEYKQMKFGRCVNVVPAEMTEKKEDGL